MKWFGKKRIPTTLLISGLPYAAGVFITLDPVWAFATQPERFVFLGITLAAFAITITYPGYED